MSRNHTRKLIATNRLLAYCRESGDKRSRYLWVDEPRGMNKGAAFQYNKDTHHPYRGVGPDHPWFGA